MKLRPLEQFVCDYCGEIIERPEEGWLEYLFERGDDGHSKRYGFRLVHHAMYSPLKETRGHCYHYAHDPRVGDLHLTRVMGDGGLVRLLSFLDVGPYHEPDYDGPGVKDIRELIEVIRRLHTPYYEEARLYWTYALGDGFFDGDNEYVSYLPEQLKLLIQRYGRELP